MEIGARSQLSHPPLFLPMNPRHCRRGRCHPPQPGNLSTVVNSKLTRHRCPLRPHRLVQHQRTLHIRHRSMKRPRRNLQNISIRPQPHNMKRHLPGKIHQIKRPPSRQRQQIILLIRVQIKLPVTLLRIIRTHRRPLMKHQIPRIRIGDRNIKKPDTWGIPKLLVRNE
jgi:hypothetical protein